MKSIIRIIVKGGLIQSIAVSLDLAFNVHIIVQDYDCDEIPDCPNILQDTHGDYCEVQCWGEKDFTILNDRERESLQTIVKKSS